MSRSTLLFVCALLAVVVGLLVSYVPPTANGAAVFSLVNIFVGYGIRDLFVKEEQGAPVPAQLPQSIPVASVVAEVTSGDAPIPPVV